MTTDEDQVATLPAFALRWSSVSAILFVVLIVLSMTARPAAAVGAYNNAALADKAVSYWSGSNASGRRASGAKACQDAQKPGDSGGQCRAFVNCIVWMVSGHNQNLGGSDYFQSLLAAGTKITDVNALVKGDVVQIGQGVHTFIIVSRVSAGQYMVVDSNEWGDETVGEYQRSVSLGSTIRAFRLGTVGPGPLSSATPDPALVATQAGVLHVFVRGMDNALWHRYFNASGWSAWESLGGNLASQPSAASWGSGRLDVFARAIDNSLIHKWYTHASGWQPWESLGGSLTSAASATSWGDQRLDVFARGSDGTLAHIWLDHGPWQTLESLGGQLISPPSAISWGPARLDVFAEGTDTSLQHLWLDHGPWQRWESLGGRLTSAPAAASWGAQRLDVFARAGDNSLAHIWLDHGPWQSWESLGGILGSAPTAASWGPGRIDVLALGTNRELAHTWLDHGPWQPWESLGGLP